MLFVSVNTLSHLQSAETLVCLHCLADCLKHTQTHALTRRLLELKPGVRWTCLSHFHPARHSARAQTFTDYRLNRVSFIFSSLIEDVSVLLHSYRLVHDTLRWREVMGGSQVFAFSSSLLCRAAVCGQQSVGRMPLEESQPSLTHPHAAALTRKNSSQVM